MKICLIIDDYIPSSIKVGAKMMHELACELTEQGNEVTVITPSSNLERSYEISILDKVTIYTFRSGTIKNTGKIKRAINESLLSYNAKVYLKKLLKENPHDLIVYYSPTIFWGSLVNYLKKLWDAPSYLILRDFFPQWAIDQGLIKKNSLIEQYFRYFEQKNYNAADIIGVMSQKNLEWFNSNTKIKKPTEVLFNWASSNSVVSTKKYRKLLKLEDKVVYFYGGNIGHAQDMMNIIRLAIKMKNESLAHFVLVGTGDEVELISNAINKYQLENITLLPPVSQEEFKLMLAEFDIGLFTLHKNHTTHNFPGKLLGYMVQKLPILGSINKGNDIKEIIENAKAGFITINGEDELFYQNALNLLNNNKRLKMGINAYSLLESYFSVRSASKKISSLLHI